MPFQLATCLKAVPPGHDHVHQNQIGSLDLDCLLQAQGIVDRNRPVAGAFEHRFHQGYFSLRIVDNQYLLQKTELSRRYPDREVQLANHYYQWSTRVSLKR